MRWQDEQSVSANERQGGVAVFLDHGMTLAAQLFPHGRLSTVHRFFLGRLVPEYFQSAFDGPVDALSRRHPVARIPLPSSKRPSNAWPLSLKCLPVMMLASHLRSAMAAVPCWPVRAWEFSEFTRLRRKAGRRSATCRHGDLNDSFWRRLTDGYAGLHPEENGMQINPVGGAFNSGRELPL